VTLTRPHIGRPAPALETDPLLRGAGCYVADVALDRPLHLHLLRSPVASARLEVEGVEEARALPGVAGVHLAADLGATGTLPVKPVLPMEAAPDFPLLAGDTVRAVGQPVAAILAESPEAAMDAAEALMLEDEALDPDRPDLAAEHWRAGAPDQAFARAAHVVEARVAHPVLAPSPMEPRGIAVACDPGSGRLTVYHSTQTPHRTRAALCAILGLAPSEIRVIAPHVGGAFGMKGSIYPEEVLAVWAARHHGRDVRWIASRSEEFLSATHGRGLETRGMLA